MRLVDPGDERGAILPLMALLMVVLLGVVGFAVDLGWLKGELESAGYEDVAFEMSGGAVGYIWARCEPSDPLPRAREKETR